MSVRAHQGLLRPTAGQSGRLDELLELQRILYAALEERRGVWRWEGRSVTRYEQYRTLTGWDDRVLDFGVCPARGTLLRLDRAFKTFHRRARAHQRAGFPRFKAKARFDSIEYPDRQCWRIEAALAEGRRIDQIRHHQTRHPRRAQDAHFHFRR